MISKKKYDQDMAKQRQQLNKQTQLYMAIQEENAQLQAQLDSMKDMLRMEMMKTAAAPNAGENSAASNEMVTALQKEMEQLKVRHNADLDSMLQRIKDKEVLVESAKNELEEMRKADKSKELEITISDLQKEVKQLKDAAEKAGNADTLTKDAHDKATKGLQELIDKQQRTLDNLEKKLGQESAARMKLEDQREELETAAKAAKSAAASFNEEAEKQTARVADLKEQLQKLDDEYEANKEALETATEQVTTLEAQIDAGKDAVSEAEAARAAAESIAQQKVDECEKLRNEAKELNVQLNANTNRISEQEQMIKDLDESHHADIKGMKISYRRSAALVKHLKKELSRLAKKFSRQEAEIYRLQKNVNELDAARDGLEVCQENITGIQPNHECIESTRSATVPTSKFTYLFHHASSRVVVQLCRDTVFVYSVFARSLNGRKMIQRMYLASENRRVRAA